MREREREKGSTGLRSRENNTVAEVRMGHDSPGAWSMTGQGSGERCLEW